MIHARGMYSMIAIYCIDETLEWLVGDEAGCYRRGGRERNLKASRVGQDYVPKSVSASDVGVLFMIHPRGMYDFQQHDCDI